MKPAGNPAPTRQPSVSPLGLSIACIVAVMVFILVTGTATLVTFIMPETFASTARVLTLDSAGGKTSPPADSVGTQIELLRSGRVLERAAAELKLAESLGRKFGASEPLRPEEVVALLSAVTTVRQVRGTALADVTVLSESPNEAAAIANQIAAAYCSEFKEGGAKIVDSATPSLRPMWPNKPLNIGLGMLVGLLLGGLIGGLLLLVSRRKRPAIAPPPIPAR